MKPEIDLVLRATAAKLLGEVAPALGDAYLRGNVEVMAALLIAAAEDYDRAAAVRVEENEAMRRIFREALRDAVREAAPSLGAGDLRARLESAAAVGDASLRVADLNAANDRLRALLIELHALVEVGDEEWARRTNRAIWEELRASASRRAIGFYPL